MPSCEDKGRRGAAEAQPLFSCYRAETLLERRSPAYRRRNGAHPPIGAAAGPKLRKWYGEGERGAAVAQPRGPGGAPRGEPDAPARTAVLVTDADSPTGEQIVLQLILARWRPPPRSDRLCRHGWRHGGSTRPSRVLVSRWSRGPARWSGSALRQGVVCRRFKPACIQPPCPLGGAVGKRFSQLGLLRWGRGAAPQPGRRDVRAPRLLSVLFLWSPHMSGGWCKRAGRMRTGAARWAGRQEVRVLVRDAAAARAAFGEYVTPVEGGIGARRPCTRSATPACASQPCGQQLE